MKTAKNGNVMSSHLRRPSVSILLTAGSANKKLIAPGILLVTSLLQIHVLKSHQNLGYIPWRRGFYVTGRCLEWS